NSLVCINEFIMHIESGGPFGRSNLTVPCGDSSCLEVACSHVVIRLDDLRKFRLLRSRAACWSRVCLSLCANDDSRYVHNANLLCSVFGYCDEAHIKVGVVAQEPDYSFK